MAAPKATTGGVRQRGSRRASLLVRAAAVEEARSARDAGMRRETVGAWQEEGRGRLQQEKEEKEEVQEPGAGTVTSVVTCTTAGAGAATTRVGPRIRLVLGSCTRRAALSTRGSRLRRCP